MRDCFGETVGAIQESPAHPRDCFGETVGAIQESPAHPRDCFGLTVGAHSICARPSCHLEQSVPQRVILSDERSEESNFCGMEYPSRSRIRNKAKARSGICERFMTRLLSQSYIERQAVRVEHTENRNKENQFKGQADIEITNADPASPRHAL